MIKAKLAVTYIMAIVALYGAFTVDHSIRLTGLSEAHHSYSVASDCGVLLTPEKVDTINQAIDYTGFIKLCKNI